MKFIGNLTRNGQAVARGLALNIRFHGKRWQGEIHLPKGTTFFMGVYDLRLNDGRKGKIMITEVPPTSEEVIAYFQGDGDLK